jgi:hypothetical protein
VRVMRTLRETSVASVAVYSHAMGAQRYIVSRSVVSDFLNACALGVHDIDMVEAAFIAMKNNPIPVRRGNAAIR